jgi:hypothetical protein
MGALEEFSGRRGDGPKRKCGAGIYHRGHRGKSSEDTEKKLGERRGVGDGRRKRDLTVGCRSWEVKSTVPSRLLEAIIGSDCSAEFGEGMKALA